MKKAILTVLAYGMFVGAFAQIEITLYSKISGKWESDWGPVQLNVSKSSVSGSWDQSGDGKGEITNGSFDAKTKTLSYTYSQPWNKMTGKATLVFSETPTGYQLSGSWRHDDGSASGTWSMNRPNPVVIKDIDTPGKPDSSILNAEQYTMTPVPVSQDTAMQTRGRDWQ